MMIHFEGDLYTDCNKFSTNKMSNSNDIILISNTKPYVILYRKLILNLDHFKSFNNFSKKLFFDGLLVSLMRSERGDEKRFFQYNFVLLPCSRLIFRYKYPFECLKKNLNLLTEKSKQI